MCTSGWENLNTTQCSSKSLQPGWVVFQGVFHDPTTPVLETTSDWIIRSYQKASSMSLGPIHTWTKGRQLVMRPSFATFCLLFNPSHGQNGPSGVWCDQPVVTQSCYWISLPSMWCTHLCKVPSHFPLVHTHTHIQYPPKPSSNERVVEQWGSYFSSHLSEADMRGSL